MTDHGADRIRRRGIKDEWLRQVLASPIEVQRQKNGFLRHWGYIEEMRRYLRVITLADGSQLREEAAMKYRYDGEHDVLAIDFREAEYGDSEEVYDGFVIDFDTSGRPMGIEIYQDASKFIDIGRLLRNFKQEHVYEREPSYLYDAPIDKKKP